MTFVSRRGKQRFKSKQESGLAFTKRNNHTKSSSLI